MTNTLHKIFTVGALAALAVSAFGVTANAQYGGTVETGTVLNSYPDEAARSTSVFSVAPGGEAELTTVAGVVEAKATLENGGSGSIDIEVVSSDALPGELPGGVPLSMYSFDFSGVNKEDVELSMTIKLPESEADDYNTVRAYGFNSPAEEVTLTQLAAVGGNVTYSVETGSYEALVIMGDVTGQDALIRTGGKLLTTVLPAITLAIVLGASIQLYIYNQRN